jgi:hypothetical protein
MLTTDPHALVANDDRARRRRLVRRERRRAHALGLRARKRHRVTDAILQAFDLLELDGEDLRPRKPAGFDRGAQVRAMKAEGKNPWRSRSPSTGFWKPADPPGAGANVRTVRYEPSVYCLSHLLGGVDCVVSSRMWRADATPAVGEAPAPREPKGLDLDRDAHARRRFIEGEPV